MHPEEHRQTLFSGEFHAFRRRAGDDHLGARRTAPEELVGTGHHGHLAEAVALPAPRHPGLAQPVEQKLQRLGEALLVRPETASEHLQVDPGAATPHPEGEASAAGQVQQRGLLAEHHRVLVGQHAHRRAHADPAGAAEQQRGQGRGGRAHPVRHEVVLRQPDGIEPGLLRDLRGADGPVQGLTLPLARKLSRQYERSYAHRLLPPYGRRGCPPTGNNV